MTRTRRIGAGLVFFVVLALGPVAVCQRTARATQRYYETRQAPGEVSLRGFPYPFRAALAIGNDPDGANSLCEFLTIQEFLNTRNKTALGPGLGLEIGSGFFAQREDFGFVSPYPEDREVITDLIRAGYVDFIHSFDRAETREEIERVVDDIAGEGLAIGVWVNHSNAPSNLGAESDDRGDDKKSEAYHVDYSRPRLGYDFAWIGEISGIVGQARPVSNDTFFDGFDPRHPAQSLVHNVLKEQVKFVLAAAGSDLYSMRVNNELVHVTPLDDGRPIFEFTRANQCYYGVWDRCATAAGLADTLREEIQEHLIDSGGYMIVYAHLAKNDGFPYLPEATTRALRALAARSRAGRLWVSTTSRLLHYYVNKTYLDWEVRREDDVTSIVIHGTSDPVRGALVPDAEALGGLTFYVEDPARTRILIEERELVALRRNPPDATGRPSVSIPLRPLPRLDAKMEEYRAKGYF